MAVGIDHEARQLQEQVYKRSITPPGPADMNREDTFNRPGIALPTSGESGSMAPRPGKKYSKKEMNIRLYVS